MGAAAGPAYILNPAGQSCYGQEAGKDIALQTDFAPARRSTTRPRSPRSATRPSAGLGPTASFFAPAGGRHARARHRQSTSTRAARTSWPRGSRTPAQFRARLAGASERPPVPHRARGRRRRRRARARRSSRARRARPPGVQRRRRAAGPGWPKLTGDWMVANPLGRLLRARSTPTPTRASRGRRDHALGLRARLSRPTRRACPPGSWPRFHHDNANSGDSRRDAVLPGQADGHRQVGLHAHLHGAGRRPAVRHRGPLRDRDVRASRSTATTSIRPSAVGRSATGGGRHPAVVRRCRRVHSES